MPTTTRDVYSFGMVLLEVAHGTKPIMMKVEEDEYEAEEMDTTLKLGLACCHPDPMRRPNMNEIVSILVGEATASIAPAVMLSELSRGDNSICGRDDSSDDQPMEDYGGKQWFPVGVVAQGSKNSGCFASMASQMMHGEVWYNR
ncbi:hypothetical protein FF1_009480 [Malus domestica]